jgi:hypothetical protein
MDKEVRYFRSQTYLPEYEISEDLAGQRGTYLRVTFRDDEPERAKIVVKGELQELIYYGRDPRDASLVHQHREKYGAVPLTIYAPASRTAEGDLLTLSGWNPAGELFHITKRLVDKNGEPLREEIFDGDGTSRGVRHFIYGGGKLLRIVFTRSDGAEIIELEDR